jgi:predicted nucleic acid binding AN1-type Zn finger protein
MKQQTPLKTMTQSKTDAPPADVAMPKKPKKPRCSHTDCRKKLGIISFTCKCGQTFCVIHQAPHTHNCPYDHGKDKRNDIQTNNPSILPAKIEVV